MSADEKGYIWNLIFWVSAIFLYSYWDSATIVALRYQVDVEKLLVDPQPYDCDWTTAPLGAKHCSYVAALEKDSFGNLYLTWRRTPKQPNRSEGVQTNSVFADTQTPVSNDAYIGDQKAQQNADQVKRALERAADQLRYATIRHESLRFRHFQKSMSACSTWI